MLCGRLPFYSKSHDTLFDLILNQEVKYPSALTPTGKSILMGLLNKNPSHRSAGLFVGGDVGRSTVVICFGRPTQSLKFWHDLPLASVMC